MVCLHVNGELDLDRRADRHLRIEVGDDHLLDDAILLEDRHDDAAGLVVGAAGELKHARQRRSDRRDDLLDALPAAVQHLDLQRLGDELRRQHAASQLPAGVLVAHRHHHARRLAALAVADGQFQGVVRLRLQLHFLGERAALVEKRLIRQPRGQRADAHRTAVQQGNSGSRSQSAPRRRQRGISASRVLTGLVTCNPVLLTPDP